MSDAIEISVQLRDLLPPKAVRNGLMVCVLFENDTEDEDGWRFLGSSTPVPVNAYEFTDHYDFNYCFERTQLVKVCIARYTTKPYSPSSAFASAIFKVDELIGSFGMQLRKPLSANQTISSVLVPHGHPFSPLGSLLISAKIPEKRQPIVLQFHGQSLDKKEWLFDETSVFFKVLRVENDDTRTLLYTSEAIRSHSHPKWQEFSLETEQIADDRNRLLEVCVMYRDVNEKEGTIGKFLTTYAKMKYGVGPDNVYNVINESKKAQKKNYVSSGRVELTKFTDVSFYSFLDYIVSGTQLHFAIAVDFHQGVPLNDHQKEKFENDVQLAIRALGNILRDYSPNRLFPAFGFGGVVAPYFDSSDNFPLSLNEIECRGLDGVVDSLRRTSSLVEPSPMANLAPVIASLIRIAATSGTQGLHYNVSVIFTKGGEVPDYKESLALLSTVPSTPMSIIFIGVMGTDYSQIQKLVSKCATGRRCVEFFDLHTLIHVHRPPAENRAAVAEQILGGIPVQMTEFMHENNITAKPPIQVCRSPLFHSSFLIPDKPTEFSYDEGTIDRLVHRPSNTRRGSDGQFLQVDNNLAERLNMLSVRMPERSRSVLQTTREQYLARRRNRVQE